MKTLVDSSHHMESPLPVKSSQVCVSDIMQQINLLYYDRSSFLPVGSYNSYRKYVIPTFARLVKVIQICTMYLLESKIVSSSKTSSDRVLDTHFDKYVLGGTQINRTLPFEDIFWSSQIYVLLCLYVIRVQPYCLINARNTHF